MIFISSWERGTDKSESIGLDWTGSILYKVLLKAECIMGQYVLSHCPAGARRQDDVLVAELGLPYMKKAFPLFTILEIGCF
jgi:hypothetical protein